MWAPVTAPALTLPGNGKTCGGLATAGNTPHASHSCEGSTVSEARHYTIGTSLWSSESDEHRNTFVVHAYTRDEAIAGVLNQDGSSVPADTRTRIVYCAPATIDDKALYRLCHTGQNGSVVMIRVRNGE